MVLNSNIPGGSCELIVLAGAPLSGKSTYSERYHPQSVLSYDLAGYLLGPGPCDPARHDLMRLWALTRLRSELRVIVEGTNLEPWERYSWLGVAGLCKVPARLIFLHSDLDTLYERNTRRINRFPLSVIERCFEKALYALSAVSREPWLSIDIIST